MHSKLIHGHEKVVYQTCFRTQSRNCQSINLLWTHLVVCNWWAFIEFWILGSSMHLLYLLSSVDRDILGHATKFSASYKYTKTWLKLKQNYRNPIFPKLWSELCKQWYIKLWSNFMIEGQKGEKSQKFKYLLPGIISNKHQITVIISKNHQPLLVGRN